MILVSRVFQGSLLRADSAAKMAKVLFVESDKATCQLVQDWLDAEHHQVEFAVDGPQALSLLSDHDYDVLILSWDIPGVSGPGLLHRYRASGGEASVIMLVPNREIFDNFTALNDAGDDCLIMSQPFDLKQLSARLRSCIRRANQTLLNILRFGELMIDTSARRAYCHNAELDLKRDEFALLEFFARNPNRAFSDGQFQEKMRKAIEQEPPRSIDVIAETLRKKIAAHTTDERTFLIEKSADGLYKLNTRPD